MAGRFLDHAGGIRSLANELKTHGGAINYDLMRAGWTRADVGSRLSWGDLRDFIQWLPPTGESALHRSRRPRSWWVTPELQLLSGVLYSIDGGNWQRGGGKGPQPKPTKFPEERKDGGLKTADDLAKRRERLKRGKEKRGNS